MNKDSLGRKISELIEENKVVIKENEEVLDLEISKIKSNPEQPRVNFDSKAMKQLADSILQHGVIQPVIMKPSKDGYILVAGERRVRASSLAGKTTVPAIVREYNEIYLTELSILENLQREDLSPIEEAIAYERAIKNLGLTQAELAERIGKSRSYITNVLGLLNLPVSVMKDVDGGLISMGHAKVLSKLEDTELIAKISKRIIQDDLSVRKVEEMIQQHKNKRQPRPKVSALKKYEEPLKQKIESVFGPNIKLSITANDIRIRFLNIQEIIDSLNKPKNS